MLARLSLTASLVLSAPLVGCHSETVSNPKATTSSANGGAGGSGGSAARGLSDVRAFGGPSSTGGLTASGATTTSGTGGAGSPLAFEGIVADANGSPVANAHVSLDANPAVSADTGPDGSFVLSADYPWGILEPPLFPATRPVEHTIVATKEGYLRTYRGVPGAQASGLSVTMLPIVPTTSPGSDPELTPSVAQYLDERRAAVTMTFDDTQPTQLTVAKPLFDQYGYKATFYLITSKVGPDQDTTWAMWKDAANAGYEIGNHTRNHWLKDCTPENDAWNHDQVFGGFQDIVAGLGAPPLTFAFPGGGESPCTEPLVAASGHVDWRRANHIVDTDRVYPEGDDLTAVTGIANIDSVIAHTINWNGAVLSWFLFYMHEITPDRAAVLGAMLDYISANDDQVWCTGYGAVTLYEREREQSVLDVFQHGPRSATFRLTNGLDPSIFYVPLTVIVPFRSNTRKVHAQAFREGADGPLEVRVRDGHLLVDAVPGPDPVHVTW